MTAVSVDARSHPPSRFDLTSVAEQVYRRHRLFRYALCVVVVLMAAVIIQTVLSQTVPDRGQSLFWISIATVLFLGAILGFAVWAIVFLTSRGAETVEIGPDSLRLGYRSGATITFHWSGPAPRIRLQTFTPRGAGFADLALPGTYSLWGPWYKYNRINQQVTDSIVEAAVAHGLRVVRHTSQNSDGVTSKILITGAS